MLRKSLGYGGMIHEFKNYILRQDQGKLTAIQTHLATARDALTLFDQRPLNAVEQQAVAKITEVIDSYAEALETVTQLAAAGQLPRQIDAAVGFDDTPALRGLDQLARQIASQSGMEADNMQNALAIVATVSTVTAWVTVLIVLFLVIATVWLFRSQIVVPIAGMTATMTNLAAGDLDQPIHGVDRDNEIGEMARALEVFKANAKALRQARDDLEQRIQERTRALQESEQRFRDFASAASDWFWEMDENRRYRFITEAVSMTIGRDPEWYKGREHDEVVAEFYNPKDWQPFDDAVAARRPFRDLTFARTGDDGAIRWIRTSGVPIYGTDGEFLGYRGSTADVTGLMQTEVALHNSEEQIRMLLENGPMGVAVVKHEPVGDQIIAKRLFANQALAEMVGLTSPEELIDTDISDSWLDQEALQQANRTMQAGGELNDFESQRLRSDGTDLWISMNSRPILFDGQDCTVIWHFDITERKHAEEALRTSEQLFRSVLDNTPVAVGLKDLDGRFELINRTFEEFFKTTIADVVGRTTTEILPAEIAASQQEADRRVVASGEALVEEHAANLPGRQVDFVRVTKFPVFDQQGEMTGIGTFVADISAEKAAEEQLRQSQKLEAVGQLTGGVAHDFNNILAAIIGNLDMITDGALDGKQARESVEIALAAALRGAELTHHLLAFSRKQTLDAKISHINEILPRFSRLATRTIGEDIAIEMNLAADLWPVMVDTGQLENALLNLAINARDAMPGGGELTIETANQVLEEADTSLFEDLAPGEYVMIAVSDNGTGMPAKVRERVLEPFYTTKDVGMGSGLGLSMVFGFAKQSGGHLSLYSEEGHGTTVKIYLPRADNMEQADTEAAVPQQESQRGTESILVVEDNPDVLNFIVKALERLGYAVLQAEDGPAALEVMSASGNIDMLLTDVVLPRGMSGRDVANAFSKQYPGSRVLFSSGYTRDALSRRGQLDQDVALINKPYQVGALAKRVREALDQKIALH